MAFCTNCGMSLEQGVRFCTNCGTPAQIAPVAPATAPTPAVATAPAAAIASAPAVSPSEVREAQPELAAEPRVAASETPSSAPYPDILSAPHSSTSPIFVIICVVLLVLIIGGIAGTVYFQRQGKAKATAAQPPETAQSSETPSPNASPASSNPMSSPATSAPSPMPSEVKPPATPAPATSTPPPSVLPVADSIRAMNLGSYPGATPAAIATLSGETVVAGFLTRDTPRQVMQFYKIRFPVSTTTESEGKAELSATLPGGERLRIQAQPQGTNTQVMVLQER